MVAFTRLCTAAFAGLAVAAPMGELLEERASIDLTVLQFALTLEHVENVFYKEAIGNFTEGDFHAADEQAQVTALEAAIKSLGATPAKTCSYNFQFTNVKSFITLSSVLEGVGTTAYLGAAPLITSNYYLTVAGAILAVEALHTSMQRLAIGEVPMGNPFMTPLDPNSGYALASAFIVKCPTSNPPLPLEAFPSLRADGKVCTCEEPDCSSPSQYIKRSEGERPGSFCRPPSDGDSVSFTAKKKIPAGSYVTSLMALLSPACLVPSRVCCHPHTPVSDTLIRTNTVPGDVITAKIPSGISGQTYVFVTKSNVETTFDNSKVLFGPAVLEVNPPTPAINDSIL